MLDHDVLRLALKLYTQLDTPRSLACFIMAKSGEWDQLVNLRVDPYGYEPVYHSGVEKYRRDNQATEFLRKYEGVPTSFDLEQVALDSFRACEAQCAATNARLDVHHTHPVFTTKVQWAADAILRRARSYLLRKLGPLPKSLNGRFGPGATFESKDWRLSTGLTAYDKLQFTPSITSGARFLESHLVWETAFGRAWGDAAEGRFIPETRGNRFATVKKDATKHRGICVEPGVNLLGQMAVGRALRKCLLRMGIDLTHGQDLHKAWARLASVLGDFVTIDLSNASDTVAYLLVKLLLPEDWFAVVDSLRSPMSFVEGRWVKLEKFSSMGNGFTFELETLLFCALLHAVGCKIGVDTVVYGDDIICPADRSADALAVLRYMGFTPNDRKTFTAGYFRESCGGDYFNGADVRPYYLKETPHGPHDWIGIANGLWSASRKLDIPELMACRNNALDRVPADIRRCRGPQALGDLVVHEADEAAWNFTTRNSIRYFRVWRPVTRVKELYYRRRVRDCRFGPPRPNSFIWITTKRSKRYRNSVVHAAALLGLPSDGLVPRGQVSGHRFGRVAWS